MTSPVINKHTDRLVTAQRHETDCWEALTTHTANCAACLEARRVHSVNGYGCEAGQGLRRQWLTASQRRYELSPQYLSRNGDGGFKPRAEDEQCK